MHVRQDIFKTSYFEAQGCTVSHLKVLNNIRKVAQHLLKSIAALLRYIISVKIAPNYTSSYKVGIFSRKFTTVSD